MRFLNKDNLFLLQYLPSEYCVITDPPFGKKKDAPIESVLYRLKKFIEKSVVSIVISDWRNSALFSSLGIKVGELVWEYGWISGGRSKAKSGIFPCHNTIHVFGDKKRMRFIEGSIIRGKGLWSPRQCSWYPKHHHPYEKPVGLFEYFIKRIDCNVFVDPFAGVGGMAIACLRNNKLFYCAEKEKKWFDIAVKRIKKECNKTESN